MGRFLHLPLSQALTETIQAGRETEARLGTQTLPQASTQACTQDLQTSPVYTINLAITHKASTVAKQ